MTSGEHLRQLRLIKGIKQKTAAKMLGISQPAYCKLERSPVILEKRLQEVLRRLNYNEAELDKVKSFYIPL